MLMNSRHLFPYTENVLKMLCFFKHISGALNKFFLLVTHFIDNLLKKKEEKQSQRLNKYETK